MWEWGKKREKKLTCALWRGEREGQRGYSAVIQRSRHDDERRRRRKRKRKRVTAVGMSKR